MKILWFVATLEDVRFLKEFKQNFSGEIDVFHLNLITRLSLGFSNTKNLLPFYKRKCREVEVPIDLSKTFNVLSERLNEKQALRAYQATKNGLEKYCSNTSENEDLFFMIPSGRHVHHMAATDFAKEKNLKRLYINYSNFPGYTFFDPEGTDCLSSIYRDPTLLEQFEADNNDIDPIFSHFSELKKQQKSIPQASASALSAYIKKTMFKLDTVAQVTFNYCGDRRVLKPKKKIHNVAIDYDQLPSVGTDFMFFPLQVSTDQQVLVNYDGGSIYKAIDEALSYAESKGLPLVVKEHPAEMNKLEVAQYIIKLQQAKKILISNLPVPEIIEACSTVVTVNSTVGLESRIQRKPIKFLGKSFYDKATDIELAKYLNSYLIPVDYHRPSLNKALVEKIVSRSLV